MKKQTPKSRWAQFLSFCWKTLLAAGVAVGLSLAIWLVVSLVQGRFGSPDGALLLGAVGLFVLAMLPFFFDVGATLIIPLRVLIQKKEARQLLEEDRSRSETGFYLTLLFSVAGALVLVLSFLAGWLFGG